MASNRIVPRFVARAQLAPAAGVPFRSARPFSAAASLRQPESEAKSAEPSATPELVQTSFDVPEPSAQQLSEFSEHLGKRKRLVPSRYHYRSPRYYRGPLHPHQPPPKTSPASREYVPGPFSLPRMLQTYDSVLESDLMALFYQHAPPGTVLPEKGPRLRPWDGSSPYHKNRPLRGPRGRPQLTLQRKIVTFKNVPTMEKITVSTLLREGGSDSATTHVAGMVLQALTGKRAEVHIAKRASTAGTRSSFTQKIGKPIAVSVEIKGEQMWHFLSTLLTVVLPKIKEWPGVKARSGDRSGNYGLGVKPDYVALWPEIAVNYDAYPTKLIPGIDIHLQTTAATDRDGRLLLSALGLPFVSGGNR